MRAVKRRSGQSSQDLDVEQRHVSQNLQLCDAAQVLDSVFVVQLVVSVNGNSELLRVTQDDHLHTEHTEHTEPLCWVRSRCQQEVYASYSWMMERVCEDLSVESVLWVLHVSLEFVRQLNRQQKVIHCVNNDNQIYIIDLICIRQRLWQSIQHKWHQLMSLSGTHHHGLICSCFTPFLGHIVFSFLFGLKQLQRVSDRCFSSSSMFEFLFTFLWAQWTSD